MRQDVFPIFRNLARNYYVIFFCQIGSCAFYAALASPCAIWQQRRMGSHGLYIPVLKHLPTSSYRVKVLRDQLIYS